MSNRGRLNLFKTEDLRFQIENFAKFGMANCQLNGANASIALRFPPNRQISNWQSDMGNRQ